MYERVLGESFASLDPQLRVYFGRIPEDFEGVGAGHYEEAGLRLRLLRPLFALLGRWHVAFAEHGERVPFTIRNTPGPSGVLRAVRSFAFPSATREMTDTMRVVDGRLVDRVGSRGQIEVEFDLLVLEGGVRMRSRRVALCVAGRRLPLPPIVKLVVEEHASVAEHGMQHVDVRMIVPLLGVIYGYHGSFAYSVSLATTVRHNRPRPRVGGCCRLRLSP